MYLKELDANLVVVLDALLIDSSVTKAAERLGRSPSAVSHALHHLRKIFGDELFVRAGQRLVPTAKALSIAPTVHIVVSGMESLLRPEMPFDPSTVDRSFTIFCSEAQGLSHFQEIKENIAAKAPNIEIEIVHHDQQEMLAPLRQGIAHLIISEIEIDEKNNEVAQVSLYSERYVTLARQDHPFVSKSASKKEFAKANHLLLAGAVGSVAYIERLEKLTRTHEPDLAYAETAFTAFTMTLQSDVLLSLPESLAKVAQKHMALVTLQQPFKALDVPIYMNWHRANDRDECHAWLRSEIINITSKKEK